MMFTQFTLTSLPPTSTRCLFQQSNTSVQSALNINSINNCLVPHKITFQRKIPELINPKLFPNLLQFFTEHCQAKPGINHISIITITTTNVIMSRGFVIRAVRSVNFPCCRRSSYQSLHLQRASVPPLTLSVAVGMDKSIC